MSVARRLLRRVLAASAVGALLGLVAAELAGAALVAFDPGRDPAAWAGAVSDKLRGRLPLTFAGWGAVFALAAEVPRWLWGGGAEEKGIQQAPPEP